MYITDSVGEGPLREGTRTIGEIDFSIVKVRGVKAAFSDALRTLRTTRSLSAMIRDYLPREFAFQFTSSARQSRSDAARSSPAPEEAEWAKAGSRLRLKLDLTLGTCCAPKAC